MRKFIKSVIGLLLVTVIVFSMMIDSSAAVKRDEYKFVLEWGSFGTELGQFRTPVGLEVDKIGNVYVSDMLNHRIQKFNSKGKFLTAFDLYIDQFGSIISYDNISPCGLTLDKEGNIYVADFSNPQVLKYSPNGQFLLRFDTYCSNFDYSFETPVPCDVAVDESGNVYIPVSLSNVIMKFDSSGQYLGNFASDFSFDGPTNIEIDPKGNIIIGQHVNEILKFSSAGDFLLRPANKSQGVD